MQISPSFQGATGLTGVLAVQAYSLADGSVLLTRTTAGITEEPASSGIYWATYTVADAVQWVEVWDDGAGSYAAESKQAVAVVGTAISVANGVTAGGSIFVIKRGDSAPNLSYQARRADGSPVNILGSTILFKMRALPNQGTLLINRAASITDGLNGLMLYSWQHSGADTVTAGEYDAEFQVTFPDGSVETFPTTDPDADAIHEYLTIKIPSDLD